MVLPTAHWSEREAADEELYSDPCPVVIPQKAVEPPGEAWDDWQFWLELGKRFKPEWWPWNNTREMWQWRMKTFYGIDLSWEELAEQGYFITYGGDKRVFRNTRRGRSGRTASLVSGRHLEGSSYLAKDGSHLATIWCRITSRRLLIRMR